jgi:hypothetical protein
MEGEILQRALALWEGADSSEAIEMVTSTLEPEAAAKTLLELNKEFYWKRKDLASSVRAGLAGTQFGLAAARQYPDHAYELRSIAKSCAFNVGSFTWPGWDEPGITVGPFEIAIGSDAAQANLRLAEMLQKGHVPLGRAHWLVGAFDLALKRFSNAIREFSVAHDLLRSADPGPETQMVDGYRELAHQLNDDAGAKDRLDQILLDLRSAPEGSGLADQLATAERVFTVRA